MKNYKLINKTTGGEYLCTKVTIDGFDYYVSDKEIKDVRLYYDKWQIEKGYILNRFPDYLTDLSECKLVIATSNFNIDAPKIIDEVDALAKKECVCDTNNCVHVKAYIKGYNKCKETNSFSEEDVLSIIQSLKDYTHESRNILGFDEREPKEFLDIWKEQKVETIYYE